MSKEKIILIGGGGHCHSCIDVIEQESSFSIAGILDLEEKVGQSVLGYPIIGCDRDIEQLAEQYDHFFITLAHIKSPLLRAKIYRQLKSLGKTIPAIISPLAHVSKHAKIGEGTMIMHHAFVNANSLIGNNCIVNSKALIEHDVSIGFNNHLSTSSVVNGGVKIGDNCFIGSRATISNNVTIADEIIIGLGSLVLKDIATSGIYHGVPVKERSYE